MTDFNDMLSKAKAMQEKMQEAQKQIKNIEVEGVAGDACENLTKDLEAKLGDLTRRIHNSEYYQKQENVTLQHNQDQT